MLSTVNSFSPSRPMPDPVVNPKMYFVSMSRQELASSARAGPPHQDRQATAQSTMARRRPGLIDARIALSHPPCFSIDRVFLLVVLCGGRKKTKQVKHTKTTLRR